MEMQSFPAAATGDYVLLKAGALLLLLPLQEVGAVEYLDGKLCASETPGLLKRRDSDAALRFIAISERMKMLPACPPGRFIAATIGHDDELFWCWDEFQVMLDADFSPEPLPAVLLEAHAPFDQYVKLEGGLAYVCDARTLRLIVLGDQEVVNDGGIHINN